MLKDRGNQEDSDDCFDVPIAQRQQRDMDTDMESGDETNDTLDFPQINADLFNIIRAIDIDREVSPETWAMIEALIDQ